MLLLCASALGVPRTPQKAQPGRHTSPAKSTQAAHEEPTHSNHAGTAAASGHAKVTRKHPQAAAKTGASNTPASSAATVIGPSKMLYQPRRFALNASTRRLGNAGKLLETRYVLL